MKTRSLLIRLTLCFTFMFVFAALSYGQSNATQGNGEETEQIQQKEAESASFVKTQGQNNSGNQNGASVNGMIEKLEKKKEELEGILDEMDPNNENYTVVEKKLEMVEELLKNQ